MRKYSLNTIIGASALAFAAGIGIGSQFFGESSSNSQERSPGITINHYHSHTKQDLSARAIVKTEDLECISVPAVLSAHLTTNPEEYSLAAAAAMVTPELRTDIERVQEYILDKAYDKSNCLREETDYNEEIEQISFVRNINLLYLIKGYVDFFDDQEHVNAISEMIEQDLEDHFAEFGGIVIQEEGGYIFTQIDSDLARTNLEHNFRYLLPEWTSYVGKVGTFHLHATKEDDSQFCGPSGSIAHPQVDLGSLVFSASQKQGNTPNKYQVDCVITKLEGNSFNVDVYFMNNPGDEIMVLDLGVYERE